MTSRRRPPRSIEPASPIGSRPHRASAPTAAPLGWNASFTDYSDQSAAVVTLQDATAPVLSSLMLANGQLYTNQLTVAAHLVATDPAPTSSSVPLAAKARIVSEMEVNVTAQRSVVVQHGPATARSRIGLVEALPRELETEPSVARCLSPVDLALDRDEPEAASVIGVELDEPGATRSTSSLCQRSISTISHRPAGAVMGRDGLSGTVSASFS